MDLPLKDTTVPNWIQSKPLFQLLQSTDRNTLQFLCSNVILPALRVDFITKLPLEIAYIILGCLDGKDLLKCAQVSKYWHQITDK